MHLLALRGNQDVGKTSTISKMFEIMKKSGFGIFQDRKRKGSHDFYAIVTKNGKKIGICSYGDVYRLIRLYGDSLVNAGCTVIVVACHLKGRTVDAVEHYRQFGYSVEYIEKLEESKESDEFNAQRLISRINELVS